MAAAEKGEAGACDSDGTGEGDEQNRPPPGHPCVGGNTGEVPTVRDLAFERLQQSFPRAAAAFQKHAAASADAISNAAMNAPPPAVPPTMAAPRPCRAILDGAS